MNRLIESVRKLYHWVLQQAAKKNAPKVLAGVAFTESIFFPIPPDVLLIPMVMTHLKKAFWFATICTVASAIGGVVGYLIGHYGFDYMGQPLIDFYHAQEVFDKIKLWYADYGVLIVAVAGFSPIPYKVFTITSGFVGMDMLAFFVTSLLSRGARFYLVAGLLWYGGEAFKQWIERHFGWLTMLLSAVVVGLIVLLKVM